MAVVTLYYLTVEFSQQLLYHIYAIYKDYTLTVISVGRGA